MAVLCYIIKLCVTHCQMVMQFCVYSQLNSWNIRICRIHLDWPHGGGVPFKIVHIKFNYDRKQK